MKGHVAAIEASGPQMIPGEARFVHWSESSNPGVSIRHGLRANPETIHASAVAALKADLPPIIKKSGRERMSILAGEVKGWIEQALRATDGKWTPPTSLVGKIVEDSWRQGDPISPERVTAFCQELLERTQHQSSDLVPVIGRPGIVAAPTRR